MSTPQPYAAARQAADGSGVPANAAVTLGYNNQWIFYSAEQVAALNPLWNTMLDAQKRAFLGTGPAGVYLIVSGIPDVVTPPPITIPTPPSVPSQTPTTPPVVTPPVNTPSVNLATIVDVSKRVIERNYQHDSMQPVEGDSLIFRNTSGEITVRVSLTGIQGVIFTPDTFSLNPAESKTVAVSFDVTQLNQLPEGTSTLSCVMALSSDTVLGSITPPEVIPPPPVVGPPPVVPTNGQWLEERFSGTPETEDLIQILSRTPFFVSTVDNINYNDMPVATVTRWTKKQTFIQSSDFGFNITTDDGMRVYIDGQLVLNQWFLQGATSYTQRVTIPAGDHTIQVLHYNNYGPGVAIFAMAPADVIFPDQPVAVPPAFVPPVTLPPEPSDIKPLPIFRPEQPITPPDDPLIHIDPIFRPFIPLVPPPTGPDPIEPGVIEPPPSTPPYTEPTFVGGGDVPTGAAPVEFTPINGDTTLNNPQQDGA